MKIYWIFLILAIVCALFSDKIDMAVKADKKLKKVVALAMVLICTLICVSALTGCTPKETKKIEFPFGIEEVENVEMYYYEGAPADAKKKLVEERTDIEELYSMFEGLELKEKKSEEKTDATVLSFRFNLTDGTDYELIYVENGVKNGLLKSSSGGFEYFTSADVSWNWFYLDESLEAVPEKESELPVYP